MTTIAMMRYILNVFLDLSRQVQVTRIAKIKVNPLRAFIKAFPELPSWNACPMINTRVRTPRIGKIKFLFQSDSFDLVAK